ncbi:MAG: lipolytic protein family [Subtercola sp.]|nr:lipolytic protein family [Subtercola sp.]
MDDRTLAELIRGCAYPAFGDVSYPRADVADLRLPSDIVDTAKNPASVVLRLEGDARFVDIVYSTSSAQSAAQNWRAPAAGTTFIAYDGRAPLGEADAVIGGGTVRLPVGTGTTTIYLPEGLRPTIDEVRPIDGDVMPVPQEPRWLAYGDSITEGWGAASAASSWVATVSRELGWEAVNLGYAGCGRGELAVADAMSRLQADVVSIAFGTNCWSMVAFDEALLEATLAAFVATVRQGLAHAPIVLASPIHRPDAETTPNRLGCTLADLRDAFERTVLRLQAQDPLITLVSGGDLVTAAELIDRVHPDDAGHRLIADAMKAALAAALHS